MFSNALHSLMDFHEVFVPLFVRLRRMDPLGLVPFLVTLLRPLEAAKRARVVRTALLTGLAVGLVFLGLGKGILAVLDIGVSHFLVAGGLVLLLVSLRDMLATGPEVPPAPGELIAVVPIGTPLLVGPAAISLLIPLTGLYPVWLVILGFLVNMVAAWGIFRQSDRLARLLGEGGLMAFAKVATSCSRPSRSS